MIKGAIFDADGTLLDSMSVWDTIGEKYLQSIGYKPREDLAKIFKKMNLHQAACYYREEYGVSLSVNEITDGVNNMLRQYYLTETKLKPGVTDFLARLNKHGVKMCVATASDRELISGALYRLGVSEYFAEIFTCASSGNGKDSPEIYRQAAEFMNTSRADTLVFEDALYTLRTASADGFITVGVYDCHEPEQDRVKETSDIYLTEYSDFDGFISHAEKLSNIAK